MRHCSGKWLGAELATSRYLKQWWPASLTHICIKRPRLVNEYDEGVCCSNRNTGIPVTKCWLQMVWRAPFWTQDFHNHHVKSIGRLVLSQFIPQRSKLIIYLCNRHVAYAHVRSQQGNRQQFCITRRLRFIGKKLNVLFYRYGIAKSASGFWHG